MIINNNGDGAIILSDGERKEMNISAAQEVQDHIIKVLTDYSYQRKTESIVRESVTNSVDANIEAGKKTAPVYVRFKRNNQGRWYFETEDQGVGLNAEDFDKYIMGIGESTKRNNPETYGYFGAGAKAALCKVNSFDWICRKDGIERKFTVFKTSTRPNREIIYERPTDKPNGCIVHIELPAYENVNTWKSAMKEQLAYLPYIIFDMEGESDDWNQYKIYQTEHFEMRELTFNKSEMHISLGGIYYPIDWEVIDVDPIYIPVALRFGLDEGIAPIFSREALQYNPTTAELIKNKITKVAEWFRDYYNTSVESFDTFWEAFPHINVSDKNVIVQGRSIRINPLLEYANLIVKELEVKGVNNKRLSSYKKDLSQFFAEYQNVGQTKDYNAAWLSTKRYSGVDRAFEGSKQIVLVDELPIGNFRSFLQGHFGKNTVFITKSFRKRNLWNNVSSDIFHIKGYHTMLELEKYPRSEWREIIKEWQMVQKQLTDTFKDGKLKDSKEYKEFLKEKKERERERRRMMGKSSDTLDKQQGQVTIGYIRKVQWKDIGTYDREAIGIEKLEKMKNLMVYFIWEEGKEKWSLLSGFKKMFPRIGFIGMNQSEIKQIKHIYQFKTIEEFMQAKPFARAVTSIAIQKYMEKIPTSIEMLYLAFPKYKELYDKLKTYQNRNSQDVTDDFAEELFEIATQNGNWDMNIYTEFLEFKRILDDMQFLHYIKDYDDRWDTSEEDRKRIKTLVYVFTRDKKIQNNILSEYELINHANSKEPEFDYYRPETDSMGYMIGCKDEDGFDVWIGDEEAWNSKETLMEQYPGCTPIGHRKGTREKLVYQDIHMEMKVA